MTDEGLKKIVADTAKTVDKLATSTQVEFMAVRNDIKEAEEKLMHAIDRIDLHLSSYASRWNEEFAKLHDWVESIDNRVKFLEKAKK